MNEVLEHMTDEEICAHVRKIGGQVWSRMPFIQGAGDQSDNYPDDYREVIHILFGSDTDKYLKRAPMCLQHESRWLIRDARIAYNTELKFY